eukprot:g23891.t1
MDHVCRDTMYLDKRGKNLPNVALILMATFMCGCIKLCMDPCIEKDGTGLAAVECSKDMNHSLSPVLYGEICKENFQLFQRRESGRKRKGSLG